MTPRRIIAALLLGMALTEGIITASRAVRAGHAAVVAVGRAERVDGRLALFRDPRDRFVTFLRTTIPEDAAIVVVEPPGHAAGDTPVTGPPGRCGNGVQGGTYWLLVYVLVPRPSVCSDPAAWTIYYGVPVPEGPKVRRFSATLGVRAP